MAFWNKMTYSKRLFLWLLGYSALLVSFFIVFQYNREKDFKVSEINSNLQLINTYIISELHKGVSPQKISLEDFHPFEEIRVSVISDNGKVLYDNTLDSLPNNSHIGREEISEAIIHGTGYTIRRHSESNDISYFYSAKKGHDGLIVRTAVPYSVSLDSLLQADYSFLWVMGAISVIMCVLGYFATRRIGLHILRLNEFANNVEHGVIVSETAPFPDDELGSISNHLVRLYTRLQQANAERDNEHRSALYEQQEKERIKKQLTNNINHELKTPVASIQVCVETLLAHKELNMDEREVFLKRCLSNTERLRRLLADVALITRMDDGGSAITKEEISLTTIIAESVAERNLLAESKGMHIENDVLQDIAMIGNASLIESIFNNLIDNAIAYSGASILKIGIASVTLDKIYIEVSDNGVGVPDKHLSRLFERFYRVDKGRSRLLGGTGLGLAIVKNAVNLHGGSIVVENRKNGGLLFRFSLSGVL